MTIPQERSWRCYLPQATRLLNTRVGDMLSKARFFHSFIQISPPTGTHADMDQHHLANFSRIVGRVQFKGSPGTPAV